MTEKSELPAYEWVNVASGPIEFGAATAALLEEEIARYEERVVRSLSERLYDRPGARDEHVERLERLAGL